MKQVLAILAALALLWAPTACGGPTTQGRPDPSGPVQAEDGAGGDAPSPGQSAPSGAQPGEDGGREAAEAGRVLVAWFSATGNTERIARCIQSVLDADLYEIVPEDPYTSEDLDYSQSGCRASLEQNDPTARPAIAGTPENPERYDVVFLGYPIWWGQAPRIMETFLEGCDFGGAAIVPFCTSGSSGIGSSAESLQPLAPDARWLPGQRFDGSASRETVASWVEGLDLFGPSDAEETRLLLTFDGGEAVVVLEDNETVRDFVALLPADFSFEDYAGSEKISYLDQALSTADAPASYDPRPGDVTLYAPWGNLAVFYADAGSASGLVPMGRVVSGLEQLSGMDGTFAVSISVAESP